VSVSYYDYRVVVVVRTPSSLSQEMWAKAITGQRGGGGRKEGGTGGGRRREEEEEDSHKAFTA